MDLPARPSGRRTPPEKPVAPRRASASKCELIPNNPETKRAQGDPTIRRLRHHGPNKEVRPPELPLQR
jgi:hypothetical protein